MFVKHLDHLNLTVADLDATERFYRELFGFRRVEGGERQDERWAILQAGEAMLCVYERPTLAHEHRLARTRHGLNHFALRITDREAWLAAVERSGVALHHGGAVHYPHSDSWYLTDPTGYEIEVALWDHDRVRFEAA